MLSWSEERTVRSHLLDGTEPTLAFHFDAAPTVVIPTGSHSYFVADALGRVHVLDLVC